MPLYVANARNFSFKSPYFLNMAGSQVLGALRISEVNYIESVSVVYL